MLTTHTHTLHAQQNPQIEFRFHTDSNQFNYQNYRNDLIHYVMTMIDFKLHVLCQYSEATLTRCYRTAKASKTNRMVHCSFRCRCCSPQCSIFSWKTTIVNYFNSRWIASFVDTTKSNRSLLVFRNAIMTNDNNGIQRKILYRFHNRFHSSSFHINYLVCLLHILFPCVCCFVFSHSICLDNIRICFPCSRAFVRND